MICKAVERVNAYKSEPNVSGFFNVADHIFSCEK